jgi:hypothetical protein
MSARSPNEVYLCVNRVGTGAPNYLDYQMTDLNLNNYTSLGDYNSTMNFVIGSLSDIDLNDNEYIRIRAYSNN